MAAELKSYVEKYLLNPSASSFYIADEDGNEETRAKVVDGVLEEEDAKETSPAISKLRLRNAAILAAGDARYLGKKVSRKDLSRGAGLLDPFLATCTVEDVKEESGPSVFKEKEECQTGLKDEEPVEREWESGSEQVSEEGSESAAEQDTKDFEDEDDDDKLLARLKEERSNDKQCMDDGGFTYVDDGDYAKYGEDLEDDDDDDDTDEEGDSERSGTGDDVDEDEGIGITSCSEFEKSGTVTSRTEDAAEECDSLKKFSQEDETEEVEQGCAVKNQLAIYDALFEARIGMQKVLPTACMLPQHDTYHLFKQEKDPNYLKNHAAAKKATNKLLKELLELQMLLLSRNSETKHIATGNCGSCSDEIISSGDEVGGEGPAETHNSTGNGKKRKWTLEEYRVELKKRHMDMQPFRDRTLTKWYEKTQLLSKRSKKNMSGFEVSALQQLNNILANKDQLIRRTQLVSASRGNMGRILGKAESSEVSEQEYDEEIFDDSDFYIRCLEEVLKSKVAFSNDMAAVSKKWVEIQNLRKRAKRKLGEVKMSKDRKLRYDVKPQLQQYMAPMHHPSMGDAAINMLFASLFGKSLHQTSDVSVK